jgi:hypothetical protein
MSIMTTVVAGALRVIAVGISCASHEIQFRFSAAKLSIEPPALGTDMNRRIEMRYQNAALMLPLLVAMAAGCTTMGSGTGSTPSGASAASFNWKSSDGVSGTINATTSDGKTFSGQYFQITKETTVDSIGPLWGGWAGRGGRAWGYWGADPSPDFITHYSGRVVANLAEPSGTHMRCQFQLVHPSDGMNGGGLGQCQLPDGMTIDANFPKG